MLVQMAMSFRMVYSYTFTREYIWGWRSEVDFRYLHLSLFTLVWEKVSQWNQSSPFWLDWMDIEHWKSTPCLCSPALKLNACTVVPEFYLRAADLNSGFNACIPPPSHLILINTLWAQLQVNGFLSSHSSAMLGVKPRAAHMPKRCLNSELKTQSSVLLSNRHWHNLKLAERKCAYVA